jgi:hypothetical protein
MGVSDEHLGQAGSLPVASSDGILGAALARCPPGVQARQRFERDDHWDETTQISLFPRKRHALAQHPPRSGRRIQRAVPVADSPPELSARTTR